MLVDLIFPPHDRFISCLPSDIFWEYFRRFAPLFSFMRPGSVVVFWPFANSGKDGKIPWPRSVCPRPFCFQAVVLRGHANEWIAYGWRKRGGEGERSASQRKRKEGIEGGM